jgi:hypothetical protein
LLGLKGLLAAKMHKARQLWLKYLQDNAQWTATTELLKVL